MCFNICFSQRHRILREENYNRMGFKEMKEAAKLTMVREFTSPLVAELRANNGVITRGDLTIHMAEYMGFCWGTERAVCMKLHHAHII